MFRNSKLLFWTCEILLLTVIFYIWKSMGTLISPFVSVLNTILLPFLIAGFLYYITNPIVELLEKHLKIKRVFGILITLVLLFGIIGLGIFYLLPILINQLTSLINSTQGLYWEVQSLVRKLSTNPLFQNINIQSTIQQLNLSYMDILQNLLNSVTNSLGSVVNTIVNTVFILIMTPIFLVYFLALIIGTLAYIGYSFIGLKYALVFAIFSGLANLIPYVGPTIGLIPMIITYAFTDMDMMIKAVIYMLIIQQIDGNILYPRIVGGVMKVHPITIMVLLLLSSNIYGIIGMVVAIPVYSIGKEIVKFLVNLYDNHRAAQEQKKKEEFGIINKS